jgi:hypothetical protein
MAESSNALLQGERPILYFVYLMGGRKEKEAHRNAPLHP